MFLKFHLQKTKEINILKKETVQYEVSVTMGV